jgi:hypothetical protein
VTSTRSTSAIASIRARTVAGTFTPGTAAIASR